MERETHIKHESPIELVTRGPHTALRMGEITPTESARQAVPRNIATNVQIDIGSWPEGEDHPYYQVNENLEYAVCNLQNAAEKRSKRGCIQSLEEAWGDIKRAKWLLPSFVAEVQSSLRTLFRELTYALDYEHEFGLKDLKVIARESILLLEATREKIAELIVADEDARYPGCGNDEGELIVEGLSK
jgi:hypothetical protein